MLLLVGSRTVAPLPVVLVVVMSNDGLADGLLENRRRNLGGVGRVFVTQRGLVVRARSD